MLAGPNLRLTTSDQAQAFGFYSRQDLTDLVLEMPDKIN
jgi:hypothetical protein